MDDKIEVTGHHVCEFGTVPSYREKDTGTMDNTDTMALLTRLVNELKAENEMLKSQIFTKKYEPETRRNSDLASQIAAIESGNVVRTK